MIVEVCANSLESALNAEKGGADRIELCSELGVGGITPSHGLIQLVVERLSIPVHVLVRPRSGHFTYSEPEMEVLLKDIENCNNIGVSGIVTGVLNKDATINEQQMRTLVKAVKPLHFTFHRAFDWVPNPKAALAQLEDIGVDTILTSGQSSNAEKGITLLKELGNHSEKITIMAGAGINATNVHWFKELGMKAIHLSGTQFGNSISINDKVSMNSSNHLAEHHIAVTQTEAIRKVVQSVK
ncbi:copper homeostasis protein CutC [Maribacter sp. 2210JD10-5]|uniref:copper homeostasis protein CutC n=1 Tax=Maribacter sp. 2210JD10-5 TaxID=3386272 RepID=UPI0039BC6F65